MYVFAFYTHSQPQSTAGHCLFIVPVTWMSTVCMCAATAAAAIAAVLQNNQTLYRLANISKTPNILYIYLVAIIWGPRRGNVARKFRVEKSNELSAWFRVEPSLFCVQLLRVATLHVCSRIYGTIEYTSIFNCANGIRIIWIHICIVIFTGWFQFCYW